MPIAKVSSVDLETLRSRLSPEEWQRRQQQADELAPLASRMEALRRGGLSERRAIRAVAPGDPETTWVARLKRFRAAGRDGLISRQMPAKQTPKLTPEVVVMVKTICGLEPELRSGSVQAKLAALGVSISQTLVKRAMREAGVSHPKGSRSKSRAKAKVEALPLAGAELLKAVDLEVGATATLTRDLQAAFDALPDDDAPILEDTANRDERGRFLGSYNAEQAKQGAELGPRFASVDEKRHGKALSRMRTANSSEESFSRKVRSLVLLPCVTDSPKWAALRHWQGQHLEGLVGIGYQASTLDKFLRELKYGGMGSVALESAAGFWLGQPGVLGAAPLEGVALVYADISVKPVWTHAFSRSAKVARLGGRVMPATSTLFLNAGCGTPVLARSWSGHASLRKEVVAALEQYSEMAGDGTARRIVVMDREGHAVQLFKELQELDVKGQTWDFIVPLCKNVVGPKAKFSGVDAWVPFGETGDLMCGGKLELNDTSDRAHPLEVRVVGRKRRRTGKVAWYATLLDRESFPDARILELYFDRWPLQEHVFREGNGRVHLGAHHGYGKRKVANVAVLDKIDKIDGQLQKGSTRAAGYRAEEAGHRVLAEAKEADIARVKGLRDACHAELSSSVAARNTGTRSFQIDYQAVEAFNAWLGEATAEVESHHAKARAKAKRAETEEARNEHRREEREKLDRRREIYTVDTELDQVMTAFKLTFMNLCSLLMRRYLDEAQLALDTLIRAVLTLPGQRVTTPTTETVRIWRQPRDPKTMRLVDRACEALTSRGLVRNEKQLYFELVDPPDG